MIGELIRRLLVVCGVTLIAGASALAGVPLIRTLATGHEVGHVTLEASTAQLRSRLWLQRLGGSGIAHGSGDVSCRQNTGTGSSGEDEMFAFTLSPNSRQTLWRFGGTDSCVVTVSLRGVGRLAVALRGY
jgi:hypothetical protein